MSRAIADGPTMTAVREQLARWVTDAAWVTYESSIEERLGRIVIDWWEQPGEGEEGPVLDPHDLAVKIGAVVDRWDKGSENHRPMKREIIHCLMSFTGADWDVEDVLRCIETAIAVEWCNREGHDLAVTGPDGRRYYFGVPKPATAEWGPLLAPWEEAP